MELRRGRPYWGLGPGVHSDTHTVSFPELQGDPNGLFLGSDEGIVFVAETWSVNSAYNMQLLNLQIYSNNGTISYQFPGLYAAGTQDNGNHFCLVPLSLSNPNILPTKQPWQQL